MAKSNVLPHRSGLEARMDLNAAKVSGRAVGGHIVGYRYEFVSRLRSRGTPTCIEACGQAPVDDCTALVESIAGVAPESPNCVKGGEIDVASNDNCVVTFLAQRDLETCISQGRLAGLAKLVIDYCLNITSVGFGGCVDLVDTGHVCVRNANAAGEFCS